jgi:hypothetical protein
MPTIDNYDLWKRHDAEQSDWLNSRPKCSYCDNPIQDDFCFVIEGEIYCEECLNDNFRKCTDDYSN